MEEKLKSDKQKEILDGIVSELSAESPDLYYTDSSTIANLIHERIHSRKLTQEKYEAVKDLSPHDILIIMSYNTTCC